MTFVQKIGKYDTSKYKTEPEYAKYLLSIVENKGFLVTTAKNVDIYEKYIVLEIIGVSAKNMFDELDRRAQSDEFKLHAFGTKQQEYEYIPCYEKSTNNSNVYLKVYDVVESVKKMNANNCYAYIFPVHIITYKNKNKNGKFYYRMSFKAYVPADYNYIVKQ